MSIFKEKSILYPTAIVFGCIVLAAAFYLVQVDKRQSIERQQDVENQRAAEELKRSDLAAKEKECESLSSGLREEWNNVVGVTYSDFLEECEVTYTDTKTGEIQKAPLSSMQTVK
jgi:hypothetical protein